MLTSEAVEQTQANFERTVFCEEFNSTPGVSDVMISSFEDDILVITFTKKGSRNFIAKRITPKAVCTRVLDNLPNREFNVMARIFNGLKIVYSNGNKHIEYFYKQI